MSDKEASDELPAWAGPALFTTVLVAIIVLFVWFLKE